MYKKIAILLLIFFLHISQTHAEREISIEVIKGATKKISVAVSDFKLLKNSVSPANPGLSDQLTSILLDDLAAFNMFNLIENREFIRQNIAMEEKSETINFKEWSLLGSNALVKTGYYFDGNDLVIEGKLYDVNSTQLIIGKRYIGTPKSMRQMVHMLADEIYFRFTGQKGIAQSKIAFIGKHKGYKELFIMDFDGYDPVRLTADKSLVLSPDWSPNGKNIIYSTYRNGKPELYSVDSTTGNQQALVTKGNLNSAPAFSPDGRLIAFARSVDGNPEIYLFDTISGGLTRLTNNNAIDTSPNWSPNGREIVFTSDRSGAPHLYIMDAEGTNVRRLTYQGNYNEQAAWSPKGDRIAFSSLWQGKFDIFTIKMDRTDLQQLTFNGGSNERPRWSPDGSQIVFSSTRSGTSQIWAMSSDGSNQRKLTDFNEGAFSPSWSFRTAD